MAERIYLLSEEGAAWTKSVYAAHILGLGGYKRCTKEEYRKRMRQINRKDAPQAYKSEGEKADA